MGPILVILLLIVINGIFVMAEMAVVSSRKPRLQQLANEGVQVGFTSTEGLAWAEIDDPVDLSFAQRNVFPQLATAIV